MFKIIASSIHRLFGLYVCILIVAAACFTYFEGREYSDSLWWAVVTSTTVGYGDISPVTPGGRLVGVFLMHVVTLLIGPALVGHILSNIIENRDAFTHQEQEDLKQRLQNIENMLQDKYKN